MTYKTGLRCSVLGLLLWPMAALPQANYPAKPIRMIVPFPPGGSTTIVARLIGQKLTDAWGQQVVVDNRGGGNTIIGSDAMVKAAPDGYTLLHVTSTHVINPSLLKTPYDAVRDFAPVATMVGTETLLVVNPSLPANNLQELIALAKAKPLAFASGGNGSPGHMIGEQFKRELGLDLMTHIPYKGNAPASLSILSGETQVFFGALPGTLQNVRAGKLRALATMSSERSSFIPDVPSSKELGHPKLLAANWFALIGPAGMPPAIVERLHREIASITKEADVIERLDKAGYRPWMVGAEEMRKQMRSDSAAWASIIKSANIRPE